MPTTMIVLVDGSVSAERAMGVALGLAAHFEQVRSPRHDRGPEATIEIVVTT